MGERPLSTVKRSIKQIAQRVELIGEHRFARPQHGGSVKGHSDGSDDQDQRHHQHHLEEREALGEALAPGALPTGRTMVK